MKTYLLSAEPTMMDAVVAAVQQQHIDILQRMDAISILTISCTEEQKNTAKTIPGVLAIEEEGTSFAL